MPDQPRPYTVRAYPTPEGWWWYAVRDDATGEWTERMRRAPAIEHLVSLGYSVNKSGNLLRLARDQYDAWVTAGRPGASTVPG